RGQSKQSKQSSLALESDDAHDQILNLVGSIEYSLKNPVLRRRVRAATRTLRHYHTGTVTLAGATAATPARHSVLQQGRSRPPRLRSRRRSEGSGLSRPQR